MCQAAALGNTISDFFGVFSGGAVEDLAASAGFVRCEPCDSNVFVKLFCELFSFLLKFTDYIIPKCIYRFKNPDISSGQRELRTTRSVT